MNKKLTQILFLVLFIVLTYSIFLMPTEPSVDAPSYNETIEHYLTHSVSETGASNVIAAILTDYRAFDTLGETIVLFTSIVAVASVLRTVIKKEEGNPNE